MYTQEKFTKRRDLVKENIRVEEHDACICMSREQHVLSSLPL